MSELSSVSVERVKVLILGDSGVGKTSLVQLVATGQPILRGPGWTAGCNVEVRYHEYAAGTSREQPYFVELWDIGGSQALQAVRPLFYGGVHGYIFVHDMTNRKSLQNLKQAWLAELQQAAQSVQSPAAVTSAPWSSSPSTAPSNGSSCLLLPPQAPCLLIGTKIDQALNRTDRDGGESYLPITATNHHHRKASESGGGSSWPGLGVTITAESVCKLLGGAEHITADSHNARSFAPGSSNAVAISRFFDKVIDAKLALALNGGPNMLTGGIMTSTMANSGALNSNTNSGSSSLTSSTSSLLSGSVFANSNRLSTFNQQNSFGGLGSSYDPRRRQGGLTLK